MLWQSPTEPHRVPVLERPPLHDTRRKLRFIVSATQNTQIPLRSISQCGYRLSHAHGTRNRATILLNSMAPQVRLLHAALGVARDVASKSGIAAGACSHLRERIVSRTLSGAEGRHAACAPHHSKHAEAWAVQQTTDVLEGQDDAAQPPRVTPMWQCPQLPSCHEPAARTVTDCGLQWQVAACIGLRVSVPLIHCSISLREWCRHTPPNNYSMVTKEHSVLRLRLDAAQRGDQLRHLATRRRAQLHSQRLPR